MIIITMVDQMKTKKINSKVFEPNQPEKTLYGLLTVSNRYHPRKWYDKTWHKIYP